MKRGPHVALVTLVSAAACGGSPAEQSAPLNPSSDACAVLPGVGAGPVQDPAGPYYHQAALARTTDGITLTNPKLVLDHASVPDAVKLPDGRVLMYYVNGAQGAIWVARIENDTAHAIGPIAIDGTLGPAGVVDPDALILPDGKVRLFYFSGFGPEGSTRPKAMCMAESSDGASFAASGSALAIGASETLTDPSVVQLRDGSWRMAVSFGARTIMARSPDGRAFVRYDTLDYGGVPEIALMPDGRVRLYVCAQGIVSYVSRDGVQPWTREATVVPLGTLGKRIICDPSFVPSANLFVFKTG